jgi:putative FmdB family regulatory protein
MPIYEFKCEECGHIDEYLMGFSDPAPHHCTKCQGHVSKVMSQTSFALKGSGWYVTDYKAGGGKDPKSESTAGDSAGTSAPISEGTLGADAVNQAAQLSAPKEPSVAKTSSDSTSKGSSSSSASKNPN